MAFLKVKFWMRRLSLEYRYVFSVCLLLESGMTRSSIAVPLIPPQDLILFCLVRRQIFPSTKPCCLELALSCMGTEATVNSLFFLSVACEPGRQPAGWFPR